MHVSDKIKNTRSLPNIAYISKVIYTMHTTDCFGNGHVQRLIATGGQDCAVPTNSEAVGCTGGRCSAAVRTSRRATSRCCLAARLLQRHARLILPLCPLVLAHRQPLARVRGRHRSFAKGLHEGLLRAGACGLPEHGKSRGAGLPRLLR